MKKRVIAVICVTALVLIALTVFLIFRSVFNKKPPELETVRARFEALILASPQVNEILFGEGLPSYPRIEEIGIAHSVTYKGQEKTIYYYTYTDEKLGDVVAYQRFVSILDEENKKFVYYDIVTDRILGADFERGYHYAQKTKEERKGEAYAYYNEQTGYYYYDIKEYAGPEFVYRSEDDVTYDYCRLDCGFSSTDDIKDLASTVYSSAYLTQQYEILFTGMAYSEGSDVLMARYRDHVRDGTSYLQISNTVKPYVLADRRYELETMQIVKKSQTGKRSTDRYVIVSIESYIEGNENKRETVELAFALESGEWYLDWPTY